jgi:hypothetical protein
MFLQRRGDECVSGPKTAGECGEEDALWFVVKLVCGDEFACVFDDDGEASCCDGAGWGLGVTLEGGRDEG